MRIIFKHIPKTAGLSVIELLPSDTVLLGHDIKTPGYQHLYHHIDYRLKKFVFSFVRNPYDRAVSSFFYLTNGGNNPLDKVDAEKYIKKYNGDFTEFVKNAFPEILEQIHFIPQNKWIYWNGICLSNWIGKVENIQDEIKELSKFIPLKNIELPHKNPSVHDSYETYYTQETRDIIYRYYEDDFKLFNYNYLPIK